MSERTQEQLSIQAGFGRSAERFCALAGWLSGEQARGLEHSQLEARLETQGRELIRCMMQAWILH